MTARTPFAFLALSAAQTNANFTNLELRCHTVKPGIPFRSRLLWPTLWLGMIILSASPSSSQDWPQWRGPRRDGVVVGYREPKAWPETLEKRWQVEVGAGHASPVVLGQRIYVHTRHGENEVVSALDLGSGKILWQDNYPVPYTMDPAATGHGKGPKSTPAIENGRLYTFGISGILSCYDAEQGHLLWRKAFTKQFKATSPQYGASASPLVESGRVIIHVGGYNQGALIAFDAASGEARWSWNGDGPGHASPIVVELEGGRQLVTQTQQFLVGVSLSSGQLLWKIPFKTEYDQNIITPVAHEHVLLFSGFAKGVQAIRAQNQGNHWVTQKVWENPRESMYMSSPVISENLVFGFSHTQKGHFFCLDLRNGATLWTSQGRQGESASVVSAGGYLIFLTDDGTLTVVRKSPKGFEPVRRYTVADSPTWAHPVVLSGQILVKDELHLTSWKVE